MSAYETIAFDSASCTGCGDCMSACAQAKAGDPDHAASRIQVLPAANDGFELALCRQCGDPGCVSVCPAAALQKDEASGVIAWDGAKCVNCLLCTVGCTYAGIAYDARAGHVTKCDLCGGDPACVRFCTSGALRFMEAEDAVEARREELDASLKRLLRAGRGER